jgi:hypothetical protein
MTTYYQYTSQMTPNERGRESTLYASFDDMYIALHTELAELHKSIGKDWKITMTRNECKKIMESFPSITYAYFFDERDSAQTMRFSMNRVNRMCE